jgi:hypothetical protein
MNGLSMYEGEGMAPLKDNSPLDSQSLDLAINVQKSSDMRSHSLGFKPMSDAKDEMTCIRNEIFMKQKTRDA